MQGGSREWRVDIQGGQKEREEEEEERDFMTGSELQVLGSYIGDTALPYSWA